MINIANPIYDAVFKYLMEDERIARTLLSALLKKEVVKVETRPHEYSNETKDNKILMFRIDFAATVLDEDGKERLLLVELQKTWVETETLRFRRYLGAQYANKRNMQGDGKGAYALPTVAVYLLGHRVGDIEEPVIYCQHKVYDYYGKEVTVGVPDPFVESLTHDSIVVQLPLLRGRVGNRLEKVLSVFDQDKADGCDKQLLRIDENTYGDDTDMQYIVRRLTAAAADTRMREDMNVEDEYFSALENRDTAIMNRDNKIKELGAKIVEKEAQLTEMDAQLMEKDAQLTEKDAQLTEKDAQLTEKDAQLTEKDAQLTEQKERMRQMVKGLLEGGMSVDAIVRLTGLTVEEIQYDIDISSGTQM